MDEFPKRNPEADLRQTVRESMKRFLEDSTTGRAFDYYPETEGTRSRLIPLVLEEILSSETEDPQILMKMLAYHADLNQMIVFKEVSNQKAQGNWFKLR